MNGSDTMKEPEEYEEKRDIVEVNLGLILVDYTSTLSAVYIHWFKLNRKHNRMIITSNKYLTNPHFALILTRV